MRLYLLDYMNRHGIAPKDFFRSAYIWWFQKVPTLESIGTDVQCYRDGGDPPPYVQQYVRHIQQKEKPP